MKIHFKHLKLQLTLALLAIMGLTSISAQNWKLIQSPSYETDGTFVAAFNVKDEGAKGDGVTDDADVFQSTLDKLKELGGGTLYVPEGKYVVRRALRLYKGITIRGDWKKPVKGQPIEGTILMAYSGRNTEVLSSFITMEPSSGVMDLAIWYPEQKPDNIVKYPPTITMGAPNYFGNENCNAKNITLVNSYSGIVFGRVNGGTCPVINGVYGTPLSLGIEIDNIVDVGRVDWVDFSPDYWAGSGLPGAPDVNGPHRDWIYKNGTGFMMRRNDWSYTCYATIEGYNVGFRAAESKGTKGSYPNGHNYKLNFKNCETGIQFDGVSGTGIMFTHVNTDNCETGVRIAPNTDGGIQFYGCEFNATGNSIYVDKLSSSRVMMQECKLTGGSVFMDGGTLTAVDCDFNNKTPQVVLSPDSRGLLTGNGFGSPVEIADASLYKTIIDHTPVNFKKLPIFPEMTIPTHKPQRMMLYVATDAPFNAKNDEVTDNTEAIQAALNKAKEDGGGVVFLPPGKYKVLGNLTIPTGVELKGAVDNGTMPTGPGSTLEVYAGKGNPSARPFITMEEGSGLRGVVFNYPEQISTMLPNIPEYPYCVQVAGKDVYIINVGMRAVYYGIDLFTHKCDNHYIDYLAGHVFNVGIRVGGGSENGLISNVQFNTQPYACGSESKYGGWANSPAAGGDAAYKYNYDHLEFLILEDCKNQLLYNDFVFGVQRGVVLRAAENGKGPQGLSMGLGLDAGVKTLSIEGVGEAGFDFINTQIVSIKELAASTRYVEVTKDLVGEVTLFSSNYWGSPTRAFQVQGGTINLQLAYLSQPGTTGFASLSNGTGTLNLINSGVSTLGTTLTPTRLGVQSSLLYAGNVRPEQAKIWENNLDFNRTFDPKNAMERTGWTATASHKNENANNGIDGNESSRWDTGGGQVAGQWYMVDMKENKEFNLIALDNIKNASDSPNAYTVEVSTDGVQFTEVTSGQGPVNGAQTIINLEPQNARYIRITQTGSKSNYWSIGEFYVFDLAKVVGISETGADNIAVWYDGFNLHSEIFDGNRVSIYTMSGTSIHQTQVTGNAFAVDLTQGVYLILVQDGSKSKACKVVVE